MKFTRSTGTAPPPTASWIDHVTDTEYATPTKY